MFFFERSACIEFLDAASIRITTPFRQAEFDLQKMEKENCLIIDLIELKSSQTLKNLKFYAYLHDLEDPVLDRRFVIDVISQKKAVAVVEFSDGYKVAKAKIMYD